MHPCPGSYYALDSDLTDGNLLTSCETNNIPLNETNNEHL